MDRIYRKLYADLENMSLAEMYREQDRIITVVERARVVPHRPNLFLGMMNRKLDIVTKAIHTKVENPASRVDKSGTGP